MKKEILTTRTYLDKLPVNLNQGLLVDNLTEPMQIFGAYNSERRVFVLKEGFSLYDFSLPEDIEKYTHKGKAGHFAITYWDFTSNKEEDI